MKAHPTLVSSLLLLPFSLAAQSPCRQAAAITIEHIQGFTLFTVPLPSKPRPLVAKAMIPDSGVPRGAFVFSFSTLLGSQPSARVQMMAVAVELATKGRPTIVLQRELSWPEVADSAGHRQADVLCAEQWLAAHAPVKSDDLRRTKREDYPSLLFRLQIRIGEEFLPMSLPFLSSCWRPIRLGSVLPRLNLMRRLIPDLGFQSKMQGGSDLSGPLIF